MPTNKLTNEQRQALQDFADKNGTQWKSKLIHLWNAGRDVGLLRQIRNQFSHDYPESPNERFDRLQAAICAAQQLIDVMVKFESKIHQRFGETLISPAASS